jgi:chromate transporter
LEESIVDLAIQRTRLSPAAIFVDWLLVGLQSFGGGSSTFSLIHQLVIKRGWMTEDEFVRTWALAQIAPGINLLKLTVMLGYRLRGWLGLLMAVSGLLLPSATVTVLMTVGFTTIRSLPWIQATMKGILPATIGLSLAMGVQMAHPIFMRARKEGPARLGAHLFILASAALLLAVAKLSPVVILLLSGVATILLFILLPARVSKQLTEQGR